MSSPDGPHASTYDPAPLSTEHIALTAQLRMLCEMLAANAHDVWAKRRITEGWRYGPARDDEGLRHPCLVPFEQLPESEKDYDRSMVAETVRAILALGYRISAPE